MVRTKQVEIVRRKIDWNAEIVDWMTRIFCVVNSVLAAVAVCFIMDKVDAAYPEWPAQLRVVLFFGGVVVCLLVLLSGILLYDCYGKSHSEVQYKEVIEEVTINEVGSR